MSEKSVKNWDDEKLCQKLAALDLKEDDKAVAILQLEAINRGETTQKKCRAERYKVWTSEFRREDGEAGVMVASALKAAMELLAKRNFTLTRGWNDVWKRYGPNITYDLYTAACEKAPIEEEVYTNAVDYLDATYTGKDSKRWGENLRNNLYQYGTAFYDATLVMVTLSNDLCSEQASNYYRKISERNVLLNTTTHQQDVDAKFDTETSELVVKVTMGSDPVLTEKLGPVTALHYCKTGATNRYSVYFFIDEKLVFQDEYSVAAEERGVIKDCSGSVAKGSYEIPALIKNIVREGG